MNLKTTAILLVLVVAAGLGWGAYTLFQPDAFKKPPAILEPAIHEALTAERTTKPVRIVVEFGDHRVDLERPKDSTEWKRPDNWPTRPTEVQQLVSTLAGLESRFVPIPSTSKTRKQYGVDRPAVTVDLQVGEKKQRLEFGQAGKDKGDANSYSRSTFLRPDDKDEVIRLAPGILDRLRHPPEYYLQRWLIIPPQKQIQGIENRQKTKNLIKLKSITVADTMGSSSSRYTLSWTGQAWELTRPVHDQVDTDKLKTLLEAVPDVWAESFIEKPKKDLSEYGLKNPEQTLTVTRANGQSVTVLIGKESPRVEKRTIMQRPPPAQFGQPRPPIPQEIVEKFRYAKLKDSRGALNQVFEIKADVANKLAVPVSALRDPRLARFSTNDAQRVEIGIKGKPTIVLRKKDFTWNLVKPAKQEAEATKVTELLDKLSELKAEGADIIDATGKADLAKYGLAKPAGTIEVTAEEEAKDKAKNKKKKTRVYRFVLGKRDKDTSKLYVRVAGRDRINAVDDSVFKLADRPALAYRGKQVLKFNSADLAKIEVRRAKDPFALEQVKSKWRLAAPVEAEVDSTKADQLAGDLAMLDAAEYVAEKAKKADLGKRFGLGQSALSVRLSFSDKKKKAEILSIGNRVPGKPQYYAKLGSGPSVFAVKKELHDALRKSSLSYRPVQLWEGQADDIRALRVHKDEPEYRLKREGQKWRITTPFDAPARVATAKPMAEELANLRCERYVAHVPRSLAKYGLDKPYLRVTLTQALKTDLDEKKKDKKKKEEKKETKQRVLLIGKRADKNKKERFAKLGDGEAIFVLGAKVVTALDHDALDLLDRSLLSLDSTLVQKIRKTGGKEPLALERKGDDWRVVEAPVASFTADSEAVDSLLNAWSNLQALRFAAYGEKLNLKAYGLDKPTAVVTVTLQAEDKKKKGNEHTLTFGSPVKDTKGARYARLDKGPGVVVLDADTVRLVTPGYLDFVSRSVWKLDPGKVTALERRKRKTTLVISKNEKAWQINRPAKYTADKPTMDLLLEQLGRLRGQKVVAFPVKNLKPYGLDDPTAVITLRLASAGKKPVEHVLKIGDVNDKGSGDRYAIADNSKAVVVLAGDLVRQLTASPLFFRDRTLPHLDDADRITLQRGSRKAVFAKLDGVWKMTEPLEVEAEYAALDEFVKALGKLRADELVADKPVRLEPYGLSRPEAAWRFFSGDKRLMTLLVGDAEKGKKEDRPGVRHYARLAGQDLVFLLDADLTSKALAEYRNRKVWTLDAAQVEEVRYSYRRRSFVLRKVDDKWQVVGQLDMTVNADKMRDTLDALAGLKAERYVADKGASLALYGLKPPPELAVEVKTRTGKKILHIGGQEGGSKRYYARVVEGDSAAVFVISEDAAGKIVRTLKAFTQVAGK